MPSIALIKKLLPLAVLIFLSSCLAIKPGAVKSGASLFETFFTGEEGTQYFIKPLAFENSKGEVLNLDITFRYKTEVKGDATINLSLFSEGVVKELQAIEIKSGDKQMALDSIKYLFADKNKKVFESRFSSTGNLAELEKVFDNSQWLVTVTTPTGPIEYTATKKTQKSLARLRDNVFVLF